MAAATQSVTLDHSGQRVNPIKFGMIIFIASEMMFFGALFSVWYSLRAQSEVWPAPGADLGLTLALIATGILLTSSGTIHFSLMAQRRDDKRWMVIWLVATIALAWAFLLIKAYEMWTAEVTVDTNAYGTMFETLLGFHGLHMVAGSLMMLIVLTRIFQGAYDKGRKPVSLDAVGYYWHFVDVIWLGVFTTIWIVK